MILLKGQDPIGAGEDRVVFLDPSQPGRCIKISRVDFEKDFSPLGLNERLYWLSRGGQTKYFDFNWVDVCSAKELQRHETDDTYNHLPRCYGYVETDLGRGVAWDHITNANGTACRSLRDYKMHPELLGEEEKAKIWQGLKEFFDWQLGNRIMLRELAFINTLVHEDDAGTFTLYHIDAIGCADLIPIAKYSPFIRKLRIMSKVHRFRKRMKAWLGEPQG